MASALPPVDGAQARQAELQPVPPKGKKGGDQIQVKLQDLKVKLAQLQLIQVDSALETSKGELLDLKQNHVLNEQRRQDALVREQNRARRRDAKAERMRVIHVSATKIQALVRSYFVRRFVMPSVLEAKDAEVLKQSRIALAETMLGLRQNIHDLAFLEQDQCTGATRVQAWWRGVIGKRVAAIVRTRHHLHKVLMIMAKAATKIASMARGRQARQSCARLRIERVKRKEHALKMQSDKMVKSVIMIQSHVRRKMAIATAKARRAFLAKELESEGFIATETKGGKPGPSGERGRRGRNGKNDAGAKRGGNNEMTQANSEEQPDASPTSGEPRERRKSVSLTAKAMRSKTQEIEGNTKPEKEKSPRKPGAKK